MLQIRKLPKNIKDIKDLAKPADEIWEFIILESNRNLDNAFCHLFIFGTTNKLKFLIDSGAAMSILPSSKYHCHKKRSAFTIDTFGAGFQNKCGLLVDIKQKRLVDPLTNSSVDAITMQNLQRHAIYIIFLSK
ncbi:uncharacterized protein LOC119637668 [Glossina fuscipes]|uniref:Uncharacterized protein LOC119637668 n=1 Tax=Glossina fuscipes TaxID=7396 RepID=A0A9C5Z4K0_9MUSC|nr:uncharacterized protein LOC119637668 [Glossina fuscipes]